MKTLYASTHKCRQEQVPTKYVAVYGVSPVTERCNPGGVYLSEENVLHYALCESECLKIIKDA